MSRLCRLGEAKLAAKTKKMRQRKQMRALINEHITDPQLNKEFHDLFDKVCKTWYNY
jgi:hypothetical protein